MGIELDYNAEFHADGSITDSTTGAILLESNSYQPLDFHHTDNEGRVWRVVQDRDGFVQAVITTGPDAGAGFGCERGGIAPHSELRGALESAERIAAHGLA